MTTGLCSAQNSINRAYDTNGPVGECLFPENENGDLEMSGVVECDGKDAATILAGIESYIRMLDITARNYVKTLWLGIEGGILAT